MGRLAADDRKPRSQNSETNHQKRSAPKGQVPSKTIPTGRWLLHGAAVDFGAGNLEHSDAILSLGKRDKVRPGNLLGRLDPARADKEQ